MKKEYSLNTKHPVQLLAKAIQDYMTSEKLAIFRRKDACPSVCKSWDCLDTLERSIYLKLSFHLLTDVVFIGDFCDHCNGSGIVDSSEESSRKE